MARKPKPTALHNLHGTANTTRMKSRRDEPVAPGSIGDPPAHLSDDQKADWIFAVRNAPGGVVGAIDRWALEVFIVAADHHRIANREQQKLDVGNALPLLTQTNQSHDKDGKVTGGGNIIQSPYLGIMSTAGARMLKAAAELGFTPAARPSLGSGIYDPGAAPARTAPAAMPKATPGTRNERDLDRLMAKRDEAVN